MATGTVRSDAWRALVFDSADAAVAALAPGPASRGMWIGGREAAAEAGSGWTCSPPRIGAR
ncbi:hypothetical protein [Thermocatellispora tengchongensis]|uniref:hypothetical protein n=1 Tax=Thermocatellispora tengchongensis TaxID=1073253 RepID=UPI0036290972